MQYYFSSFLSEQKRGQVNSIYYLRYMDDFVIMHQDKQYLRELLTKIRQFLANKLALTLNSKTQIFPSRHGLDFCGYYIWPTHILPRKRNVKKARRMFKALKEKYTRKKVDLFYIKPRLASFLGYMKLCNGYNTTKFILDEFILR